MIDYIYNQTKNIFFSFWHILLVFQDELVTVVKSQMSNFSAISWQEQVTINEMMMMMSILY
jgi:hypothetical protein